MSALPSGWVQSTLADLGRWTGGGTPSKSVADYWEGLIPWVSPKDMKVDRITDTQDHVSDRAVQESSTNLVPPGSILVVTRSGILSHTFPVALADREVALNQDLKALIPAAGIEPAYVAWALRTAARQILDACSKAGTTVANIETSLLMAFQIPIAPLAEQRRIVAAIEEQFSRLDAAEADLRRSSQRLSMLLASSLAVIDHSDASVKSLSEISSLITDGDHNPPRRVASGVPHLTAKHVKRGRLVFDGCTFVSEEGFEQTQRRYAAGPGDVIVTCVGTIGEAAVVEEGMRFSADRNLAAIRPSPGIDSHYVRFALSAPAVRRTMDSASGSTAQPHLYLRDLRALRIPVPSLDEQRRMVAELEKQLSLIESLRVAVDSAQKRSAALRRSILERAFRGELVSQDPDDEPASVLLDRIRAERAAAPPVRRRRSSAV